ncbi:MAG: MFS transporter, partial [Caldilineaceae bacterium]
MRRRTFIFLLFTSAYFLSQFFRSTNAVIAPNLAQDLTLTASQLGLMTSLFFAVFALAQIPLG